MNIVRRYKSRQNKVYLTEEGGIFQVVKVYSDNNTLNRAFILINNLNGKIALPAIISYQDNTMVMEHIEGKTLLEEYENADINRAVILADKVITHINKLREQGYVQRDNNFTNYIIREDECIGVDYDEVYEESSDYSLNDCIADMILYAISYNYIVNEVKLKFSRELIRYITINQVQYINRAIERLVVRRGKFENIDIINELI